MYSGCLNVLSLILGIDTIHGIYHYRDERSVSLFVTNGHFGGSIDTIDFKHLDLYLGTAKTEGLCREYLLLWQLFCVTV